MAFVRLTNSQFIGNETKIQTVRRFSLRRESRISDNNNGREANKIFFHKDDCVPQLLRLSLSLSLKIIIVMFLY